MVTYADVRLFRRCLAHIAAGASLDRAAALEGISRSKLSTILSASRKAREREGEREPKEGGIIGREDPERERVCESTRVSDGTTLGPNGITIGDQSTTTDDKTPATTPETSIGVSADESSAEAEADIVARLTDEYEEARQQRAEHLEEDILQELENANLLESQINKLRVDTKRWLLSKYRPERYGDRQQIEVKTQTQLIPVVNVLIQQVDSSAADVAKIEHQKSTVKKVSYE